MVSILIPTKNEEINLPECLKSVEWSDDIHVYDSGSTDRTAGIAKAAGATLTIAPSNGTAMIFGGNEAQHRNWAIRNLPFKHNWILLIDADERVTPHLREAIQQAVQSPGQRVAFLIQRRDFLIGTWLKHVQTTPFYPRLFLRHKMRYERLINPVSVPDGPTEKISGYLDHFPFSKGIAHWLNRHNSYSTLEAEQIVANRAQGNVNASLFKALTSNDITERRFHQKEIFSHLPGRPLLKFALLYLIKLGFLDGKAGVTYAVLQSFYEYMIVLKTRELLLKKVGTEQQDTPAKTVRTPT